MKKINYITPEGLKKIQEELQKLLHVERPSIVKTVAWAAANGDRSENADYIYGKRRLREIDSRIRFLQSRLDNIDVIDPKTISSNKIKFGATITIEDEDGKQFSYQIVGSDEFDPKQNKISWQSPMAKALLGKEVGDTAIVKRPAGITEVEIIKIVYR